MQAVHNVPLVGKCTKMLLLRLFRLRPDLYLHDLHVVGFSLGAQVAGHVGRLMNSTIQRITGACDYIAGWVLGRPYVCLQTVVTCNCRVQAGISTPEKIKSR